MSAPVSPNSWTLPITLERRVDARCQEFEQAWKSPDSSRPALDAYLDGVPEQAQQVLLLELLRIEAHHRRRLAEDPVLEEYRGRFPNLDPELLAVALAQPPDSSGKAHREDSAGAAWTLPGYELLGELGRGGMGVIYRARQIKLNRIVALKVLAGGPHAGTKALLRHRNEAEAVAQLQHPNIVQIYEVGEHAGHAYLILEYVPHGGLDKYLGGVPQPARAAAQLVETLADAVHYAHQRGIVHRDLKPANVLLQELGARGQESGGSSQQSSAGTTHHSPLTTHHSPLTTHHSPLTDYVPKIADFGLAKILSEDGAALTASGEMIGTPAYMAPEQATGKPNLSGPAVDIYGLGALLYELLTGRPPFRADTALETILQVRCLEPVSPSQLQPNCPRDLVTICLKCLQKEPGRRYATAQELAEDLRRFRAGEPIQARPVGRSERVLRWCRRRPLVAGLLAALVLALAGGAAGVVWQWQRAEAKAAEARQAQELAEANYAKIRETIDRMAQQGEANSYKLEGQALLQYALVAYQVLLQEKGDDPTVNLRKAQAQLRIAEIRWWLREQQQAAKDNQQARELLERLDAGDRAVRRLLARSHALEGEMMAFGFSKGKFAKAQSAFERAIKLQVALHDAEPDNVDLATELLDSLLSFSEVLCWQGRGHDAKPIHKRTLALLQPLFDAAPKDSRYLQRMAYHLANVGLLHRASGKGGEAEKSYARGLDLCLQYREVEPDKPYARFWQSYCLIHLAEVREDAGRTHEAETGFREVIKLRKALVDGYPHMLRYHELLASALGDLSRVLRKSKSYEEALTMANESVAVAAKAVAQWRKYADARWTLANNHWHVALTLQALGKPEEAVLAYQAALAQFEKLASEFPDEPECLRQGQVPATFALGQLHMANKNYAAALVAYRKLLALNDRLVTEFKAQPGDRWNKAWDLSHVSEAYEAAGQLAEAKDYLQQSIEEFRRLADEFREVQRYRDDLDSRRAELKRLSSKPIQ
jgi:serine/threonine protein kinase/tetratricopeptide (TPR) repeat protein